MDTQRGKAVEELGGCGGGEREGTLGYLQVNEAPSLSLSEEPIRETGCDQEKNFPSFLEIVFHF